MKKDKYGQLIFEENDLVDLYLKDTSFKTNKEIFVDKVILFDKDLGLDNPPKLKKYVDLNISIEEFDQSLTQNWQMPTDYQNYDIAKFVLDQCKTEEELQRAGMELIMYQERDMFMLLRYLKYLVDTMRKNKIVWGVGRGSSVSSFVLYLIGVHKINPIFYQLSVEEFLK